MSFFALIELLQKGQPQTWKPGVLSPQEFAEEIVRVHNEYRRRHRAYALRVRQSETDDIVVNLTKERIFKTEVSEFSLPPYVSWLNDDLLTMAQQWADKLAKSEDLAHSGYKYRGTRIGENIAMKWTPQEVCDQWYSEVRNHEFGVEPTSELTAGHFTQMVWRNSTEIGVGNAQAEDGRSIVVVNYFPPANVIGEFNMNVLQLDEQ